MRIDNEIEYRAALDVFKKYRFKPNRSKNHPLQESMETLAKAVENFEYVKSLIAKPEVRKAA